MTLVLVLKWLFHAGEAILVVQILRRAPHLESLTMPTGFPPNQKAPNFVYERFRQHYLSFHLLFDCLVNLARRKREDPYALCP